MTSDARERLRKAVDDVRRAGVYSYGWHLDRITEAAEALLAEPPAPAHADHDALVDGVTQMRRWAHGFMPGNIEAQKIVDELDHVLARPRVVPDAGDDLRERIAAKAEEVADRYAENHHPYCGPSLPGEAICLRVFAEMLRSKEIP